MMMRKNIIAIFLGLIPILSFAQNSSNYELLQCKDQIPLDLIASSTSKYKKDITKFKEMEKSKKERRLLSKFSLESHFLLDRLLQSGAVLFNDEVTRYVNSVAQKVLKNDSEELRKKVKIYTLRSSYVNAFATERGDIFVTLGLIAKLKNESQLAFILAHEIAHVQEKHNIKSILVNAKIEKDISRRASTRASIADKRLLKKSMYSKELELEADSLAVSRYLGAGYAKEDIMGVFEVLKTSEHAFSNAPFDFSELESGSYALPDKYKTFEVDSLEVADEDKDDELGTHPNIGKRMEQVLGIVGKVNPSNGTSNNAVFNEAVRKARLELPMLCLHNDQASKCVYLAQVLLKENPNNKYLKKCIAKALYTETKFQNDKDYKEMVLVDEINGNIQQVYNVMEDMEDGETNALAMNYVWRLHQQWPHDAELEVMAKDLAFEMVHYQKGLDSFIVENVSAKNYWKGAMYDYKDNTELQRYFDEAKKREATFKKRERSKKKRQKRKYLGIDKIVVVNPQYQQIDMRLRDRQRLIASEEGRYRISDFAKLAAERANLKCEVLDVKNLRTDQVQEFNDLRYLNEWFSEQADFGQLNVTPGYNQEKINEIAKRHGTKYFLWTGVVSAQRMNFNFIFIFPSLLFPPAVPFASYAAIKPRYHMFYYSILFNVETGSSEVLGYDYFKRKDSDALVKAHMYDSFYQIKRSKKKRK